MTRTDRGLFVGATVALVVAMLTFAHMTSPQPAQAAPPQPTTLVSVFDTAVNADTNVFTAIGPTANRGSVAYRVTIALKSANSVVNWQISDGTTTIEADVNDGTALTAGRAYTFVIGANSDYTYTIQYETGTTTGYLLIEEVRDGVL